jgi:putative holliday junction resolvase
MVFSSSSEFSASLHNKGRLIGIDLGSKNIGISVSDSLWLVASPLTTLRRTYLSNDIHALSKLVLQENIKGIVIGWPLNSKGEIGTSCDRTQNFIDITTKKIKLPVLKWDERFSTLAVRRILLKSNISNIKRKSHVDKIASSYILQGALDVLCRV